MEITECSSSSVEIQNSQILSQDVKSISKSAQDVEVPAVNKEQITPVNESQSQDTLKSIKVCKLVKLKSTTVTTVSNREVKKLYKVQKLENVKTSKHSKQEKDKSPKTVNSDKKCNGKKSSKMEDKNAQNDSGKVTVPKEQKNKLSTTKKSPNDGNKQKPVSKHSKELLLSNYVTLSRDWTANRKTYTRNSSPCCIRLTDNYDCLTPKSEEINSGCITKSTNVSVETDSVIKDDSNALLGDQLLDNVSVDSAEVNNCAKVNFQQVVHGEENKCTNNDANTVLSETNSIDQSSDSQRTKTTILKQKNTKSKRKSVHFSDKIDLPADSLNRNDIILEIANDPTTTIQEGSLDHLSDVSANDAVNASIEIDKIQCPIKEQTRHKTYTKIVQKKPNSNASVITFDKTKQDVIKVNIVRRKRGRPRKVDALSECRKENSTLKAKVLSKTKITRLQDKKLKTTVANLQSEGGKCLLLSRSVRERRKPRKIIDSNLSISVKQQRNGKSKANLHTKNELRVKRGKKQSSTMANTEIASSQQFVKRKRGRPRKNPLGSNNYDINNPAAKKMKLDSVNAKLSEERSSVVNESIISVKSPREKNLCDNATENIFNKENKQIITDSGVSINSDNIAKLQKTGQKMSNMDALLGDGTSQLVSDSHADIGNSQKFKELASFENETQVHHSKITHNFGICNDDDDDDAVVQINESNEQKVQNTEKISPNIHKVTSRSNVEKRQEIHQIQEIPNLEGTKVLVCPETSIVENETDKAKDYRILKSILEVPEKFLDSDLNVVKSKSREQEMQNLEASKTSTDSCVNVVENESNLHKVYKKPKLKYPAIKAIEVSLNVNTNENKCLEQKTYKKSIKTIDLEALSELSNHDTNTCENEFKEQKTYRKTRKATHFKLSEVIYDNGQIIEDTPGKHRKRKKRTTNVKMLLKKMNPVSRKTKRKKKINTSKSETSKNTSAKDGEEQSFSCGVCKQMYSTLHEVNYHIMLCHNGLARINDDTPFTLEEEISAFNQTLKTVKQLQCLQPNCGKKFISVIGYKYHRDHCGVEIPKVNCEICGKVFKAVNLAKHMRLSHTPHQDIVEESTPEELPKRGAAVKALKNMENFMKTEKSYLEDSDDSFDDSDYQESDWSEEDYDDYCEEAEVFLMEMLDPWKESIKTPVDIIEEIIQTMTESWENILVETGKIKCDEKNCDKEFTSIVEMKSHLENHNAKKWICKLCGRTFSQGRNLYNHMKRNHRLQESVDDSGKISRKSNYSHINNLLNTSFDHAGGSKLLKPYLPTLEWNMKFQKKHYKNELFSQWKPQSVNWVQMKKRNSSDYLPPLKESAFIKSLDENSSWTKLSLFECPQWADKQRQKTFFVGGSVWGSAWCPTGVNSKAVQYLALAANSPAPHPLTDCSSQKGLIQLWDMGILESNRSSSTPNLTLAIAHESGSIWDMEWCPSGCWEEASDIQMEKKPDGILPRLGLLAVACSNSTVRIFSIPHPHCIVKTKDSLPIFRCRPVVVLICPESAPNVSSHQTLCTKVAWQRTNGHSCLAAGFGNGMVCLWNLMASSPLLTVSQFGGQLTLRPYLSFPAHGARITGLVWIPVSGGQYLSTASYDRSVKVWNLEDHNWPSLITKRGLITDIAWLPYWCGVFASVDDCYNLHHTATFYKECGYYNFAPKALSAHCGCTWSLSISDWLNAEASGDASGEVILTVLCQLMKLVDSIKLMSHRRVPLFRISMETLDCSVDDEKQLESVQENGDESIVGINGSKEREEKSLHPTNQKDYTQTNVHIMSYSTYEEAIKKSGLVLQDNNMENFSAIPEKEFRRVRRPETMSSYAPDQYPLNSINKVSWNPNLGSHLWLFSAGQAGIARICCVFGLQSDKLRNMVNSCKEKFKMTVDGL